MKRIEETLAWLKEIEIEDLLDGDMLDIHEKCGMETLILLVAYFGKTDIYIKEDFLFEAKKRYVRKVYDRNIPYHAKILSRQLDMSIRSVFEALEMTDRHDDRQGNLVEKPYKQGRLL